MANENNIITKEFEGTKIQFKMNEQGQSFVRIDEVVKFCGWTYKKSDRGEKEFTRWNTVNGFLNDLGVSQEVATGDFIPEYVMYPLIGKAKNERATKFMLWVGQVLTELRQKGVVILDNATDEAIDFEKKYGIYRIRRTFTNSKDLRADYEQFKELSAKENKAKRLNGKQRIKMQEIIFDAIDKRYHNNMDCLKGSEMLAIQELLTDIKADTLILSNRTNGGLKAGQTKEINKLKSATHKEPKLEDMVEIHKHPFAFNSMYIADKWGMFDRKKSPSYISWIKTFPKHEVMDMDYWTDKGVDWDLPIKLYLAFVTYEDRNFDTDGLIKSAQDMIFNRCMNIDDNIVECVEAKQIGKCSSYEEGKIYYTIENITE